MTRIGKEKPQKEIKVNANTRRHQKLPKIKAFLTCQKLGEEYKLFLMAMVVLHTSLEQWLTQYRQRDSQLANRNLR